MTKQEIINKINKEFKGKAVLCHEIQECQYLTCDGEKCAIGLFIPEGHRAQESNKDIKHLLEEYPELLEYMPSKNINDLLAFQWEHDALCITDSIDVQKKILIDFVNDNF